MCSVYSHELKVAPPVEGDLLPKLTICPTYTDSLYRPAKGITAMETNFIKFSFLRDKNFLDKNYTYKGYI